MKIRGVLLSLVAISGVCAHPDFLVDAKGAQKVVVYSTADECPAWEAPLVDACVTAAGGGWSIAKIIGGTSAVAALGALAAAGWSYLKKGFNFTVAPLSDDENRNGMFAHAVDPVVDSAVPPAPTSIPESAGMDESSGGSGSGAPAYGATHRVDDSSTSHHFVSGLAEEQEADSSPTGEFLRDPVDPVVNSSATQARILGGGVGGGASAVTHVEHDDSEDVLRSGENLRRQASGEVKIGYSYGDFLFLLQDENTGQWVNYSDENCDYLDFVGEDSFAWWNDDLTEELILNFFRPPGSDWDKEKCRQYENVKYVRSGNNLFKLNISVLYLRQGIFWHANPLQIKSPFVVRSTVKKTDVIGSDSIERARALSYDKDSEHELWRCA